VGPFARVFTEAGGQIIQEIDAYSARYKRLPTQFAEQMKGKWAR
jgi:hypothetical protein